MKILMAEQKARIGMVALITVLVSACATNNPFPYHDSAYNDRNRAPASIIEAIKTQVAQMPEGDLGHQAKADYSFLTGDLFSQTGESDQAVEKFKEAHYFDPQSAIITYRIAIEYFRKQNIADAIYWGMKAVERDPKNKDYKLFVAGLLSAKRELAKAEDIYLEVIKDNPKLPEPYLYLAALYSEMKKPELAKKNFTKLTTFVDYEQRYLGFYYLGKMAFESGLSNSQTRSKDWPIAKTNIQKSLSLKPDFMEALQVLGRMVEKEKGRDATFKMYIAHQQKHGPIGKLADNLAQYHIERGEFEKALEQLEIVESQSEDDIGTKLKLALILIDRKRFAEALVRLEKLNELVPESDKVKFYTAAVHEELGQLDKAVVAYQEIPVTSSHFEDARVNAANILRKQNNFEKAEKLLVDAIQSKGEKSSLYVGLAQVYELQAEWNKAIAILKTALEKFPESNQFNYFLGLLYDRKGDFASMDQYLRKTIENDKNHYQALNHIAYSMAERDQNLEEARDLAYRAHKLALEDGYIIDTLGWIYYKLNNFEKAQTLLEQAHEMLPEVSVIAEHLGDVYLKRKQNRKAAKLFRQAFSFETDTNRKKIIQEKIVTADRGNPDSGKDLQSNSTSDSTSSQRNPAAENDSNEVDRP